MLTEGSVNGNRADSTNLTWALNHPSSSAKLSIPMATNLAGSLMLAKSSLSQNSGFMVLIRGIKTPSRDGSPGGIGRTERSG